MDQFGRNAVAAVVHLDVVVGHFRYNADLAADAVNLFPDREIHARLRSFRKLMASAGIFSAEYLKPIVSWIFLESVAATERITRDRVALDFGTFQLDDHKISV